MITAGGRLDALAIKDVTNKGGGILAARDVSLTAVTGDVVNDRTVFSLDSSAGGQLHKDYADSASRIEAANDLSLSAGRDINNVGSALQSGRDMTLAAGRDVNITATQVTNSLVFNSKHTRSDITQLGSTVDAGGDVAVQGGRDINVVASQVTAKGDVAMTATQNLTVSSAADEAHQYDKNKHKTTQKDDVTQVMSGITAGGAVALAAGQDLALISSRVQAGTDATLVAAGTLSVLAAQDSSYSLYDYKKKGSSGKKKLKHDEVTQVTNVGSEITSGGDISLISAGNQTYQAAKIASGNDLTISAGGAITFEGVKDLQQETHTKSNTSAVWTASKGKGNTDETFRQSTLFAQGAVAVTALDGLHIDIKQVNQQSVSQSIDAMVKADPKLAWLKEAEAEGNVDWRQVKEVHDSFKYSNSGLGPASQMILAIAMAVALGPAGMGLGTVSGAAAGSLASTSVNSAISNKGNLGAVLKDTLSASSLKSASVAALTAGVTANFINPAMSGTQVPLNALTNGFDLATMSGIGGFALNAGVNGLAGSVISTAINGGSFGKNLAGSLVSQAANVAAAVGFNAIGSYAESQYLKASKAGDTVSMVMWAEGGVARTALHAMLGGTITAADGGDFATGAIAAGASEAMASVLNAAFKDQPELRAAMSQIVGTAAAGLAGKDAAQGGWIAQMGDDYNRQLHQPEAVALSTLKDGLSPAEAAKYDAAACALTHCSGTVPVSDPNYSALVAMEAEGANLQDQRDALLATGGFTYTDGDSKDDWVLSNDERIKRAGNGASAVLSVIGGASLFAATVASTPLCATGVGCVAPAVTGTLSAASLMAGIDSTASMMAPYFGTQGANVLASFDPATYPGEVTPVRDLEIKGGIYAGIAIAGGVATRIDGIVSSIRGVGSKISGLVTEGVSGLKSKFGFLGGAKAIDDSTAYTKWWDNVAQPKTLTDREARAWYLSKEAEIPSRIDAGLSLEDQAKQAFAMRNDLRSTARELMSNRDLADSLNKSDPNRTWSEIANKYSSQGLSGDDLWRKIIEKSQSSRTSVNNGLGM